MDKHLQSSWITEMLLTVFFGCLIANLYIDLGYAYQMPRSPNRYTGRVYPIIVNHGSVRFVTKGESELADFVLHWLFLGGLACGAVVIKGSKRKL